MTAVQYYTALCKPGGKNYKFQERHYPLEQGYGFKKG